MSVTSTTLAGVNVWQLSGSVTDTELKTAWASLIVNNRYKIGRYLYIDSTCSLVNVRGTYYIDSEAFGVILHSSRNKTNTIFNNFVLTQTVGLAVGARANFVRVTNGTTITNTVDDGISMKGGAMLYAVVGNPGGGDPRYLNEMQFGSLDGTVVTSAAFTEQELEPCSTGTIWKGLNLQKVAGYPILQLSTGFQRQVVYRSALNTEGTQKIVRPYYNNSVCYVSSTARRNGVAVTSNLYDTFGSNGSAVIMVLNNYTDETWFGASKTAIAGSNWSTNNRFIGGVLKKIQVQPSTLIRSYDSRSTVFAQKNTFSETTRDFLTGTGVQNFHLYSEQLDNGYWTKNGATVTTNATTAPDGATTADKVVETATTGQHRVNSGNVSVTSGVAYTYSFYAKASERSFVHARLITTNTNAQACFNLTAGTFIQSAGTTSAITDVGNGWFRCSISATTDGAGAIGYANIATSSSLTVPSYAGTLNSGLFIWGAQIETGTTAGTYIPTTALPAEGNFGTTSDASTGYAQFVSVGAIATGGSASITRFTNQKFTLQKFGYQVQIVTPDMTFGDDDLSAYSPITMAVQSGIVRTQSAINAATTITSFQDLLEELHVLAIAQQGAASYNAFGSGNLFTYSGGVLTTNFTSVTVDATASSKIVYNSTANTLVIKSSVLTDTDDVTSWNNAAGTITTANGAVIQGVYTSSAGTSTVFEFQGIAVGSSIAIYDASGVTKLFQQEVTTAGDYPYYIPAGTTGTYTWAIERYGYQRQSGSFAANTGGLLFYEPIYIEDVGLSVTNLATVLAYTEIETASKFFDRTAAFRLTEQGIKLGQIATRSGTSIEIGTFSHVINKDASVVYSITGSVITTKATAYAGDSRYSTEIATPPATITANTVEVLTIVIEDANGNSQLTINGGDGTFELWKVTTSTPTADYATGTLLDTVGNGVYRFIGVTGFDIVGVDTNSNIRRRTSMAKGIYTQAFYVGDQIQLAQAPQVEEILTKVEVMQIDVDAIQAKTDNLTFTVPNVLDANIQYVNDVEVDGTGAEGNEWGPV